MTGISPAILATSIALTGLASFSAGFLISPPSSHAETRRPIVDPDAWNIAAPAPAPTPVRTEPAKCNPWEVSDIAMEAVLDEMQQRGWRPPGSVERAIAAGNAELAAQHTIEDGLQTDAADQQGITVLTNSGVTALTGADASRQWQAVAEARSASLSVDVTDPALSRN